VGQIHWQQGVPGTLVHTLVIAWAEVPGTCRLVFHLSYLAVVEGFGYDVQYLEFEVRYRVMNLF
jgi:hypothetical protein